MPVDEEAHVDAGEAVVEVDGLLGGGLAPAVLGPHGGSHRPRLDHLGLADELEAADLVAEGVHPVRPRVALVAQHDERRGGAEQLDARPLVEEAPRHARRAVELEPQKLVLDGRRADGQGIRGLGPLAVAGEAVGGEAEGGDLDAEDVVPVLDLRGHFLEPLAEDDELLGSVVAEEGRLDLDDLLARPAHRVEEDDRVALADRVDVQPHGLKGTGDDAHGGLADPLDLGPGVVVGHPDARAGEDVVELVEEHGLPRAAQLGPLGFLAEGGEGERREALGREQELLGLVVGRLDGREHRVAAAGVVLKLFSHHRELLPPALDLLEEGLRRAEDGIRGLGIGGHLEDAGDIGLRGAAAVVAHAVEAQDVPEPQRRPLGGLMNALDDLVGAGVVVVGRPAGDDVGAVGRPPQEEARGQLLLVRPRPEEAVGVEPAALEDLGKLRRVAEGIDVVADAHVDAELLVEVALAEERLTDEALAAGDVAVGLHPPAADDVPPSLGHPLLDGREQLGLVLLQPLVGGGGAAAEDEAWGLGHSVEGRLAGAPHLIEALVGPPQPHRVDVGIADHMDGDLRQRRLGHEPSVPLRMRFHAG